MKGVAAALALVLFTTLAGCGPDEVPTATTTTELQNKRAELGRRAGEKQAKQEAVASAEEPQGESQLQEGFAVAAEDYIYSPTEKRDPFRSFLLSQKSKRADENAGPLADFELGQLAVVAVVWDHNNPRALVQDPGGRTHILREGSPVGRNRGRVIHIGDNLVLVKETYVDFAGEESTNDVELRIRRSQGG